MGEGLVASEERGQRPEVRGQGSNASGLLGSSSPLGGEPNPSSDLVGGKASRLILATHNKGKLREIAALMAPLGFTVQSAGELGLPEPEETGDTFEANAELKAIAAATAAQLPALADDSGLAVPALDGAPGIYSARWAGESKDFALAMRKVAEELAARGVEVNGAAAYFVCVLSLAQPDGSVQSFRGEIHGTLCYPPRGSNGFGYDAMFIPEGDTRSFGEFDPAEKHAISHRAKAFAKLLEGLKETR